MWCTISGKAQDVCQGYRDQRTGSGEEAEWDSASERQKGHRQVTPHRILKLYYIENTATHVNHTKETPT